MTPILRDWHESSKRNRSFLVPTVELVVKGLRCFSFLQWVIFIRGRPPEKRGFIESYEAVELYVVAYFVIIEGVIAFYLVGFTSLGSFGWFTNLVLALLAFRLVNIFGFWWDINVIHGDIVSSPRLLLLTLLSYIEIGFIFAVIAFIKQDAFSSQFEHILVSLKWSFDILLPTISFFEPHEFEPVSCWGNVIFFSEVTYGFLFLIVVIARVLAFFSPLRLTRSKRGRKHGA